MKPNQSQKNPQKIRYFRIFQQRNLIQRDILVVLLTNEILPRCGHHMRFLACTNLIFKPCTIN